MKHPIRQSVSELTSSTLACVEILRDKLSAVPPGLSPEADKMRRWLEGVSLYDPFDHHDPNYNPAVAIYLERKAKRRRAAKEEKAPQAPTATKQAPWTAPTVTTTKPPSNCPFRFRHPAQPELQWTGLGRQPNWIRELRKSGKTWRDLHIPGTPETWRHAVAVDSDAAKKLVELERREARLVNKPRGVPRFRHPDNHDLTWSGAGCAPIWMRELEAKGVTRESLLIPGQTMEKLRRRRLQPDGTYAFTEPKASSEPRARLVKAGAIPPSIAKQAPTKALTLEEAKRNALKILEPRRFKPSAPVCRDYTGPKVLLVAAPAGAKQPPIFSNPFKPRERWNGKGQRPPWVQFALDAGYTLRDMNIGGAFSEADYATKAKTVAKGLGSDPLKTAMEELKVKLEVRERVQARAKQPDQVIYRYVSPFDPAAKWTGEGAPPKWFKDAIRGGYVPSDMLIPGMAPSTAAQEFAPRPEPMSPAREQAEKLWHQNL